MSPAGAGGFSRQAVDAGATVIGIDAAPGMIEVARERVPNAHFDIGDIQSLPYEDGRSTSWPGFTASHSRPSHSRRFARRAESRSPARRCASWCLAARITTELVPVLHAIRSLLPAMPPGAPGPLALSAPGTLDGLISRAGLTVTERGRVETAYEYPDQQTALRAIGSAGLAVLAERTAGQPAVMAAVARAIAPYRTPAGGYRLAVESAYIAATVGPRT